MWGQLPVAICHPWELLSSPHISREKGFKVGLIDGVIEDLSIDQMVEKVLELNPKIIGLSALTPNFHRAIAFATLIKKRNPEILIILGGHHATILPREILEQNGCFDLIVHGEGELTAEEIVNKYKNSGWRKNDFTNNTDMLSKIKGIAFKHGKEIIITPKRELIQNLDELPFPAWDLCLWINIFLWLINIREHPLLIW